MLNYTSPQLQVKQTRLHAYLQFICKWHWNHVSSHTRTDQWNYSNHRGWGDTGNHNSKWRLLHNDKHYSCQLSGKISYRLSVSEQFIMPASILAITYQTCLISFKMTMYTSYNLTCHSANVSRKMQQEFNINRNTYHQYASSTMTCTISLGQYHNDGRCVMVSSVMPACFAAWYIWLSTSIDTALVHSSSSANFGL